MDGTNMEFSTLAQCFNDYVKTNNPTKKAQMARDFYAGAGSVLVLVLNHATESGMALSQLHQISSLVKELALFAEGCTVT